jgi:hypothetical protein
MNFFPGKILLLSLAVFALGGCRPKDPLDWRISASSPADFNDWSDRNTPLLPAETRRELGRAIQFLLGDSGLSNRSSSMASTRNPFCIRIDRQTVRAAILDGYFAEKKFLSNRIVLEVEHIAATEARMDSVRDDSPEMAQFTRSVNFKHALIQNMELRVAEIDARAKVLSRR